MVALDSSAAETESPSTVSTASCCRAMYMGEPFSLSWLDNEQRHRKRFHRALDDTESPSSSNMAKQIFLDNDETLTSRELESRLLEFFWKHFYPLYPIVNKNKVLSEWNSGTISPLLKQAILYIAVQHCPESIISETRVLNKQDVLQYFYRRARNLYDTDLERDRISVVQSMFMLQFHYGLVTGHRDNLWWLGAATNLAQVMGMHRSTKDTDMDPTQRRLWKKIWWLLYVSPQISSVILFLINRCTAPRSSGLFGNGETNDDRRTRL